MREQISELRDATAGGTTALSQEEHGTNELPPLDMPIIAGGPDFLYHTGGHTITGEDWSVFLEFVRHTLGPFSRIIIKECASPAWLARLADSQD